MTAATVQPQASIDTTDEGQLITIRDASIRVKISGAETSGALSLLEYTAPPYFPGPEPHIHTTMAEVFYVLEGALTFALPGRTLVAGPGAAVHVPPGVPHRFSNPAAAPARFLTFCTPGDFEGYFAELAAIISAAGRWPLADMSQLAPLQARYDIVAAQL